MEEDYEVDNCKNCDNKVKKGIRLCPECGELNPTLKNKEIWKIIAVILVIGAIVSLVK